ncbi:MAG: MATE family efflux transporter [bacterium]|nr:MATE family efflux transporter [bacterium]
MENKLVTEPIPKLIRMIALPASTGFFFNTMYNVVDTYFGGLQSTEGLAALSLSFPVFFLIIAVGSGVGTGITALMAHAIGERNHKKAVLYGVQGLSFGVFTSVILTIVGLAVAPFLFRLLGASDAYLGLALSFMNVIFYGTAGFIFVNLLNAILSSQGDTKSFRNFLITGFFLNFVFNYWFMFGGFGIPALGLAGVALGTVVAQVIGVAYLWYKVRRTHLFSGGVPLRDFIPDIPIYKEIAKQGFPASLSMMTIALGIFIITYFISAFGHEAVAAYGIATRIEQITLLPLLGLNIAVLTLVGQNSGAKLYGRVRETYRLALRYGTVISLVATIFLLIAASPLMKLFTKDAAIIATGVSYLRVAAFIAGGYMILFMTDATLRGLKRPMFFLWLGITRQIILPAVVFTPLIKVFHTGLTAVWLGIFAIVWSAALVALWYARRTLAHKLERQM